VFVCVCVYSAPMYLHYVVMYVLPLLCICICICELRIYVLVSLVAASMWICKQAHGNRIKTQQKQTLLICVHMCKYVVVSMYLYLYLYLCISLCSFVLCTRSDSHEMLVEHSRNKSQVGRRGSNNIIIIIWGQNSTWGVRGDKVSIMVSKSFAKDSGIDPKNNWQLANAITISYFIIIIEYFITKKKMGCYNTYYLIIY